MFFSRANPPTGGRDWAQGALDACFRVKGIDAPAKESHTRGADNVDEPDDRAYGERELVVRDCDGRVLTFGQDMSGRAT